MISGSILYVEDDEDDVLLLKMAFKRAGITNPLEAVIDGSQAIDYLAGTGQYADRQRYPLPGLVMLDLNLPRRSGLEVLAWMRQQPALRRIVAIVFTSGLDAREVKRAYDLGVNSFIAKPVDLEDRIKMAQELKAWWLDRNHVPRVDGE